VSLARSLFAFNSVNVEGWALYAEAEMVPYEPLDGQFIALQFRLLRAARAFLDPMLNLGLVDRARAHDILVNDVGLSEPMAQQELDRYTFKSPGQATAFSCSALRSNVPAGSCAINALGAPAILIRRVSARVSTPEMPGIPASRRKASIVPVERQLDGSVDHSRTTSPEIHGWRLSLSSAFTP
jgi:hypothetical protein